MLKESIFFLLILLEVILKSLDLCYVLKFHIHMSFLKKSIPQLIFAVCFTAFLYFIDSDEAYENIWANILEFVIVSTIIFSFLIAGKALRKAVFKSNA